MNIWRRVESGWSLVSLIRAFPVTMFGVNIGIGFPIIVALHLDEGEFSSTIVWIATFVTMASCVLAVRGATMFLAKPPGAPDPEGLEGRATAPHCPPPTVQGSAGRGPAIPSLR